MAFNELDRIEPRAVAREQATSVAHAGVVLVHTDGSRFVRTGWFFDYARAQDVSAGGNADIATRMERVGWHRRGAHGRIKATRKGFPGQLAWSFEVRRVGRTRRERGSRLAVTPGVFITTRAYGERGDLRARKGVTGRNRVTDCSSVGVPS